jgi:putative ABC transport system permease protein
VLNEMFPEPMALGIAQALVATVLAIAVVLYARRNQVYLERESLVALARGLVQITLVGSVLLLLLQAPFWASLGILGVMFVVAAATARRRAEGIPGAMRASLVGILLGSGVIIGLMTWLGVIEPTVASLVPVGSMVVANAMNATALALNRLQAELAAHSGQIEAALALGASPRDSVARHLQASVHASMIPRLDSIRTLGIVWIPGLMTGMVLSGNDPVYSAIYQFVVLALIYATSGLSAMLTVRLILPRVFSPAEQLLPGLARDGSAAVRP